jgi:hypothetical protein
MRKYRAVVHVSGIAGESPREVRAALGEQLRNSGLANCQVVSVDIDGAQVARPHAAEPRANALGTRSNAGWLLLIATAAWVVWFFYWTLSGSE